MTVRQSDIARQQILNTEAYPFLAGLRALGMDAIVRDGHLGLVPPDKVTPQMMAVARQNRQAIIAEIERLAQGAAADRAEDTRAVSLNNARWADKPGQPPHDLDRLELVLRALFYECARNGWAAAQYWDCEVDSGTGRPLPPPPQRPYCYIRSILVDNHWHYWPILAGTDGTDYVWADAVDAQDRPEFRSDE